MRDRGSKKLPGVEDEQNFQLQQLRSECLLRLAGVPVFVKIRHQSELE